MLQNYLTEWSNARKNATILEEQKNENGDLMLQRAEVMFHGTKIEIHNKRVVGADGPTPDDRFASEFFIPSTLTLIDAFRWSEFPSTEFIATILEATDPNFQRITKEAIDKRRAAMDQFTSGKKQAWLEAFADTKYKMPDIEVILAYADSSMKSYRMDAIDTFINCMVKYQDFILDDTVKITTAAGNTITNMDLMFELICKTCIKTAYATENKFFVTKNGMEYVILDSTHDDKTPQHILDIKNVYRDAWLECKENPAIFTVFAYGLAKFYEYKLNETIAHRLARINERKSHRRTFRGDDRMVSVDAMMNNISSAFDAAKPLKRKGKKG